MDPFATSHLSDRALLHDLHTIDAQDRRTTAVLLSRVGEVDERELFLREGYPSMYAYCIHELHFCEGTASRRIYAARAARRFPVLFDAVADGRLHVTAVVMLSKYLTSGNVDELVAAATHKSKAEIERLIAEHFPQSDLPTALRPLAPPIPTMVPPENHQHSPENVGASIPPASAPTPGPTRQHSPENVHAAILSAHSPAPVPTHQHSPENVDSRAPRSELKPLAPQRFAFQCTFDQETHDLIQDVRALMSHEVPTGELALVLKGALKLAKAQLMKRRFAATDRPGHARPTTSARHIPAAVKRKVWERDGGQCTYVSESGRRCQERARLEYDHAEPAARGGPATVENVRLMCRAHNQHEADRVFGLAFMERRRAEARRTAATSGPARHAASPACHPI